MVSQNEGMLRAYRRTAHLGDVEPVQLLGPSSWNSPVVGEKLGEQVSGALFVDSGEFVETREDVSRFVGDFKNVAMSAPAIAEALAFDAETA